MGLSPKAPCQPALRTFAVVGHTGGLGGACPVAQSHGGTEEAVSAAPHYAAQTFRAGHPRRCLRSVTVHLLRTAIDRPRALVAVSASAAPPRPFTPVRPCCHSAPPVSPKAVNASDEFLGQRDDDARGASHV